MKLLVTKYGTIQSNYACFDEISIAEFLKKLKADCKKDNYSCNHRSKEISINFGGMVSDEGNNLYAIKYHGTNYEFDISGTGEYYSVLKKNLDNLALRSAKQNQISKMAESFNDCDDQAIISVDDIKAYLKYLRKYNMCHILLMVMVTIPCLIPFSFLFFFSFIEFLIYSLGYYMFALWIIATLYDDFDVDISKPFEYNKVFRYQIKIAKSRIKYLLKNNIKPIKNNEGTFSDTKNADVSMAIGQVNVYNAICRATEAADKLTGFEKIDILRKIETISVNYLTLLDDKPKSLSKIKCEAYESKIAMDAVSKLDILVKEINEIIDPNTTNVLAFADSDSIKKFVAGNVASAIESEKKLSRTPSNGARRG